MIKHWRLQIKQTFMEEVKKQVQVNESNFLLLWIMPGPLFILVLQIMELSVVDWGRALGIKNWARVLALMPSVVT